MHWFCWCKPGPTASDSTNPSIEQNPNESPNRTGADDTALVGGSWNGKPLAARSVMAFVDPLQVVVLLVNNASGWQFECGQAGRTATKHTVHIVKRKFRLSQVHVHWSNRQTMSSLAKRQGVWWVNDFDLHLIIQTSSKSSTNRSAFIPFHSILTPPFT